MTKPISPAHDPASPESIETEVARLGGETVGAAPDIEALLQRLDELENEVTTLKDQRIRAAAETENVRKRAQRDQEETSKYAITAFAGDMVSVLENIKRASETVTPEARNADPLLRTLGEGVDLTLQELLSIFQRHGIKRLDPMGQKFDHNFHQAVVQMENNEVPPGTVVQVIQSGYVIHDRLLRPAMVAVSKQGESTKQVDTSA